MTYEERNRIDQAITHAMSAKYGMKGVIAIGYEANYFEFDGFDHLETVRSVMRSEGLTYTDLAGRTMPYTHTAFEADRERLIARLTVLLDRAE